MPMQRKPQRRYRPGRWTRPKGVGAPGPNDLTLGVSERDSGKVHVYYINRNTIGQYVGKWEFLTARCLEHNPHWPADPRLHAAMFLRGFVQQTPNARNLDPNTGPLIAAAYLVAMSDNPIHRDGPRTHIVLGETDYEIQEVAVPTIH